MLPVALSWLLRDEKHFGIVTNIAVDIAKLKSIKSEAFQIGLTETYLFTVCSHIFRFRFHRMSSFLSALCPLQM